MTLAVSTNLVPIMTAARECDRGTQAVIATDALGTILYWNDQAESMYGWSTDEVVGRNILEVTPTHHTADEAAQIMDRLGRGESWSGRFIVQHRDGTPILADVTDEPVIRDGAVVGVVGVSTHAAAG